jgi:hypothetical protein
MEQGCPIAELIDRHEWDLAQWGLQAQQSLFIAGLDPRGIAVDIIASMPS